MPIQDTFLEYFDFQCRANPDAIALCHNADVIKYSQLSDLCDRAVTALQSADVKPGDSVGLLCERSVFVVASMLACFRTGTVFVPLDPAYPAARLQYMLEDASVVCAIVDEPVSESQDAWIDLRGIRQIVSNRINDYKPCDEAQRYQPSADDRAYIMYTSGSTGQPKGVVISHSALACYCHADISVYELSPRDRTLQFSTLSFDISIEEIFPSLMIGAAVILRPSGRRNAQIELSEIIEQEGITAVHLATGYWHEWVDLMVATASRVPACLRLMVVTGDKVSIEHYERWRSLGTGSVLWANAYGPTETTVSATVFIPPDDWNEKALPIGKPLPGYSAHILDEAGLPVTGSELGELCIGGGALADEYLNKPMITGKAFVVDSYSNSKDMKLANHVHRLVVTDSMTTKPQRLYRTGDLARWRDDGNIECVGRIDYQIKVGSYRVEPGEIESVLNGYPGINEALVCGEEINGNTLLTAYLATGQSNISLLKLVEHAAQKLPDVMLPTRYAILKTLPKTMNGKVDRSALELIRTEPVLSAYGYTAPMTELERSLCAVWSSVLGVERVGVHDSFISLGGNSLMAVRVIARLHEDLNVVLSTRDFFFLDSVYLLASHLDGKSVERQVPAPQPSFINSRKRQLYTLLQKPEKQRDIQRGILLIPPLGNEQRRVQRPIRNLMQNLSRMGYTLLRFDWQGTGNSSGETKWLKTLENWQEDISDAAQALSGHVELIDIIAIRAGALIAAKTQLEHLPVNNRFYLDPVFDGTCWIAEMEQLHRAIRADTYRFLRPRKARTDGYSEFAGLVLNPALVASISEQKLPALLHSYPGGLSTHVIRTHVDTLSEVMTLCCHEHHVSDFNDWVDPRTTTDDMRINDAAEYITDVMFSEYAGRRLRRLVGS